MAHELDAIDLEIEATTRLLSSTPEDDPSIPNLLVSLGTAHYKRFSTANELVDIDKAIRYKSIALTLTASNHPGLSNLLSVLGAAHRTRFQRRGERSDIDSAVEYTNRSFDLTPNDHPYRLLHLVNLGRLYRIRFQHLGDIEDLIKEIDSRDYVLGLTPESHPSFPDRLANLGASYSSRFKRLGNLDDLERAIESQFRALSLTPEDHPDLPNWLSNLGMSYRYRFERLGKGEDIDKAIGYHSRVVDTAPDNHPDMPNWYASLGVSYGYRFQYLGELGDSEKAVECQSRALNLTPDDHPDMPKMLASLGNSHRDRFQRLGELEDVEKAIEYQSRAISLTPDDRPDMPSMLASLGVSYSDRFQRLSELGDLERAIEYLSRAVTLSPDGHPEWPSWLINLGISHNDRFKHLGQLEDLGKAVQYQSRAVDLTPDDHPLLPWGHFNRAMSYINYYEKTADPSHVQDSLHSFRIASHSTTSAPKARFQYARQWATLASRHSALNPIEAYRATIDLLPQFISLGATTDQRYNNMSTAGSLAVDAACAAILHSDHALALEWLEHARCVIWNQNMMLRSPLEQLQASHPALAARLQTVSHQMHSAISESRESQKLVSGHGSVTAEKIAQDHRQLAQEYNDLLSQTRMLPGFETFLRQMDAKSLIRAAQHGPVVVINCHADRCDALILQPEQEHIDHVFLPNYTRKEAQHARSEIQASLRRNGIRGRGFRRLKEPPLADRFGIVLVALWDGIVKPVLDFLGYTSNVSSSNLPHITWCPTSELSFLPLHAAGNYDQPQSRVFDYVISSYTPTLTALLGSTPSSLSSDTRVLAIGQEKTPGYAPLPGTVRELAQLKEHIQDKVGARYSELIGNEATTTAVLDAMEQHDWVHLACHAYQNVSNPTRSGFFLHDGILDLAAISRLSFKDKGLAFLSACQTATGDETLPDEAVHLASGMLMAGYSSVIATMWSVKDEDAPGVAEKVYAQLTMHGTLGNGEAGKALHDAVAELREKVGEKEFGHWVPWIHIGS